MNSNLLNFYFQLVFTDYRQSFPLMKSGNIESLPIAISDQELKNEIEQKVNQILSFKSEDPTADTTSLEQKIDQMVYELYGLTEEEIAIIENTTNS